MSRIKTVAAELGETTADPTTDGCLRQQLADQKGKHFLAVILVTIP